MDRRKNSLMVILVLVAFFFMMFTPQQALAGWDDNSDDLPGFSTTDAILIVGVGVAAFFLINHLVKSGKKKDAPEKGDQAVPDTTQSNLRVPSDALGANSKIDFSQPDQNKQNIDIIPYLGLGSMQNQGVSLSESGKFFDKKALVAGVALRF